MRSRPSRSACARRGSACSTAPAGPAIEVLAEHDIGRIVEVARAMRPALVVVDSVQTATVDELDGAAGSVGQVREAAVRLMEFAKGEGIAVVLVGHVTKDGSLAGPKTLEHLVDAVVTLEGERYAALRLVRATKNRFGSTDEVGVFEMAGEGLLEVPDPARAFLAEHAEPAPGSVVAPTLEGSRPLLVEVQALVAADGLRHARPQGQRHRPQPARPAGRRPRQACRGQPRDATTSTPTSRAACRSAEPGLDLPVALALASSLRERPVLPGTVVIGEVGLLGELRVVAGLERRLREAARLGFRPGDRAASRPRRRPTGHPGHGDRGSRHAARRGRGGSGRHASAPWRRSAGDARLTARPGRARPGGRRACPSRVS